MGNSVMKTVLNSVTKSVMRVEDSPEFDFSEIKKLETEMRSGNSSGLAMVILISVKSKVPNKRQITENSEMGVFCQIGSMPR